MFFKLRICKGSRIVQKLVKSWCFTLKCQKMLNEHFLSLLFEVDCLGRFMQFKYMFPFFISKLQSHIYTSQRLSEENFSNVTIKTGMGTLSIWIQKKLYNFLYLQKIYSKALQTINCHLVYFALNIIVKKWSFSTLLNRNRPVTILTIPIILFIFL